MEQHWSDAMSNLVNAFENKNSAVLDSVGSDVGDEIFH
jgi:hypothetical protein